MRPSVLDLELQGRVPWIQGACQAAGHSRHHRQSDNAPANTLVRGADMMTTVQTLNNPRVENR